MLRSMHVQTRTCKSLTSRLGAGGASFEDSRARLFGPGLQSVFQSAVGVSEDEVSGSRAGLRSMGTAVPLSELQVCLQP